MKKTIIIDEKAVLLKSTAGTAIRYKSQFRRDMFADILSLGVLSSYISTDGDQSNIDLSQVDLSKLDFEVIYNLVWAFAKTANKEVPDPLTWLDTFGEFPIAEIITEIQDLIKSTVQSKKKITEDEQGQGSNDGKGGFSVDTFLALCYSCKLSKEDLEDMTIGDCLDYIDEYVELRNPKKEKENTRTATQDDFNNF